MSTQKFFTLHVTLIDNVYEGTKREPIGNLEMWPEGFEFKDLSGDDIAEYKRTIYVQGIKIQTSPIAWEFISPFRIRTVRVFQQESKFAL